MTVDCTDTPINEQFPFSKRWYSFKFKGPGVRYEVGVCIQTGDIVWINGPFEPGEWNDLTIFRHELKGRLGPDEMVEVDRGYAGEPKVRTPDHFVSLSDKKAKAKARSRHETVNKRLKQFKVLREQFRHPIQKHQMCFRAVAVCTQLSFEAGEHPFHCSY
jgi:hypothetical protein